ncbi:DUF6049 family protein [Agromyces mangrovi Wang et al. 2018]|uniref:DUF6049 family protein n=1 Tax=Agromyces mangrovi TaxID=1858653 RepID=UPI0025732846|nr:DUF6049 family protein [Agromyces mangrovi]BDZ64626.1 hypothetical protein GCM10025877_15640 [Agromyces mangrovi]
MAAEAIPERRLRRLIATAAVTATAAALVIGAPDAPSAAAAEVEGISMVVGPAGSPLITSADDSVEFTVETSNTSGRFIGDVDVVVSVGVRSLGSSDALDDWLTGPSSVPSGTEVGRSSVGSIPIGSTLTTSIDVDADDLERGSTAVLPIFVELEDAGETLAWSTGVAVWSAGDDIGSVSLAVAAPITVPPQDTGLYSAELLEAWTSPQGILSRRLDGLVGSGAALAIDPAIIASIRVLGADAPASAIAWLDRLTALPNETFPLAYADADLAVQSQAGLESPLQPLTFDDVVDGDAAPAETEGAETGDDTEATEAPAETDDPAATDEPSPDPDDDQESGSAGVLSFTYTRTDVGWPADDSLVDGDLAFLDAAGLTTAIVSGGNVEQTSGSAPTAASMIEGATAVVSDPDVTAALRAAEAAVSSGEASAANARLAAALALVASDGGSVQRTILATFDRTQPVSSDRERDALATIASLPWAQPATLSDAIGAPPVGRTLVAQPERDERVDRVRTMIEDDAEVAEFATILDEPAQLTSQRRRDLLAVLAAGWLADSDGWDAVSAEFVRFTRETLDAVSIVPSSEFTVISRESGILVTVENDLPYPVNVVITVDPSNGRLLVDGPVEATVGPDSRGTSTIPVQAGVGNGAVALLVSLESPTGVPVGGTVRYGANVQADWEGIGAGVIGGILLLLFGIGFWRIVRRRRQERADAAAAAEAGAAEDADTGMDADGGADGER